MLGSLSSGGSRPAVGGERIGSSDGLAEPADGVGILDALGALHAGTHVNGPGPDLKNPFDHISGMQPTRQNDRKGHVARNERPIENLSTTAIALDMRVEQEALGVGMRSRKV